MKGASLERNGCISAISFFHNRDSASPGGELPTCSHAAQSHQPPLRNSGQHHCYTVPTLQATCSREDIGHLLAEFTQLTEVPPHFIPITTHPPEGWVQGSVASLKEEKTRDIEIKNKLTVTRGDGGGTMGENRGRSIK